MKKRKSTKLKGYDYSNAGWYFVTICTDKVTSYFGKVHNDKMICNELGKIADVIWKNIPAHYPEVKLDYYQIMPNHIYGIIIIDHNVGEGHALPLQLKHSLNNIIGSYKSAVTKFAHKNNYINFKWQRSFYDRIIRNEKELFNIRKYIKQNPLKWELEKKVDNLHI